MIDDLKNCITQVIDSKEKFKGIESGGPKLQTGNEFDRFISVSGGRSFGSAFWYSIDLGMFKLRLANNGIRFRDAPNP
jgi:hypothetical protein